MNGDHHLAWPLLSQVIVRCDTDHAEMSTSPLLRHLTQMRLRNLSPDTIRHRHYALARLAHHLECTTDDLLALTVSDIDQWQSDISHLSPRYRSSWQSHIATFYKWAQQEGLVRENPARVLVTVRLPRRLPKPIAEVDLEMAIRCASDRIRPWLILAGYAGLRAAEIANLTREQVRETDVPPRLVVIGKGNKERVVPMSMRVMDELRAAGLPTRGFVFTRRDGQPGANQPWHVSHLCNDYLHDLGIPHTLHSLRHRFATQVYAVTRDLRVTQELLGHEDPMTTSAYAAFSNVIAAEAVEKISGELRPVPS